VIDKDPTRISAVGVSPVRWDGWNLESIAYIAAEFPDGMLAHFHVNWLSPVKIRRTLIGGSRKTIIYDHLDPDNQVKIFDKGVEVHADQERYQTLVQYRIGDMIAPKVDQTEALETVCRHFVECIRERTRPLTDGYAGLRVVRLLEAAQQSLERQRETVLV
jgi:predicted dehydrogenase